MLVTMVTLVTFLLGCEWCMLGRSDEQDVDYYGNLGNSGNFESNCSSLNIYMRPSLFFNYGNLGNYFFHFFRGVHCSVTGWADEQDVDYHGNLGNSGNFESNCSSLKIYLRPSLLALQGALRGLAF